MSLTRRNLNQLATNSLPPQAFLSGTIGGSQLDPELGGPCRSLLSRFSQGGHATTSCGVDLQPTIGTFYMAVPSYSAGAEYFDGDVRAAAMAVFMNHSGKFSQISRYSALKDWLSLDITGAFVTG